MSIDNKTKRISLQKIRSFFKTEVPKTAADTIDYKQLYPNGICCAAEGQYNKTIEFNDINYQMAADEDKIAMFGQWCDILNCVNEDITLQLTFVNQKIDRTQMEELMRLPVNNEKFQSLVEQYNTFRVNELGDAAFFMAKKKYITFTVPASTYAQAKTKLEKLELTFLNQLKVMGCEPHALNGRQRANVLFRIMNRNRKFHFNWEDIKTGQKTTKHFVSPQGFDFSMTSAFQMGRQACSVSYVGITAERLIETMLSDLLELDQGMVVSLHISSYPQSEAQKMVRQKLSDLQKVKMDELKRNGGDEGALPIELVASIANIAELYDNITGQNERLFNMAMTVLNMADNPTELRLEEQAAADVIRRQNCEFNSLVHQQERGFISSLPIGNRRIKLERDIPTKALGILIPFVSQDFISTSSTSYYYGKNQNTNHPIIVDKMELNNTSMLVLGMSGGGKSMFCKHEILQRWIRGTDDTICIDHEGENVRMVNLLGGLNIVISPNSTTYINPMDLDLDLKDENPLSIKLDFLCSFMGQIMRRGLTAGEIAIIDACMKPVYAKYLENPTTENLPLLQDLQNAIKLLIGDYTEASELAQALNPYVSGNLNIFNHHTNIDLSNKLINFDISGIGATLKDIGNFIIQDLLWVRVKKNRDIGIRTCAFMDEFHVQLRNPVTAKYSVEVWKRIRKYGGDAIGATQNVKDFLTSKEIESILDNTCTVVLLNQAAGDREELCRRLHIPPQLENALAKAEQGEGVVVFGAKQIHFKLKIPHETQFYEFMTTDPRDLKKIEEREKLNQLKLTGGQIS